MNKKPLIAGQYLYCVEAETRRTRRGENEEGRYVLVDSVARKWATVKMNPQAKHSLTYQFDRLTWRQKPTGYGRDYDYVLYESKEAYLQEKKYEEKSQELRREISYGSLPRELWEKFVEMYEQWQEKKGRE